MSTRPPVNIILAVVLLLSLAGIAKGWEVLTARVVSDTETAVHKEVFGVNGEMLWSPIRLQSDQLGDIYKQLGFKLLRFPLGKVYAGAVSHLVSRLYKALRYLHALYPVQRGTDNRVRNMLPP